MNRRALAALAAIPLLLLVSMLWNFAVDVPYWDQWDLVPYFQLGEEGRLGIRALWQQHSEHRLLVPRAIMLALARLTGWDTRYEMAVSVALACVTGLILAGLHRRSAARAQIAPAAWAIPLFALVLFSLRQWENWIWGWQLQIHLNVCAVVAGTALLASSGRRALALTGAVALGLVAQYSFASGLFYWPAVGLVIALDPHGRARRLLAWTGAAAACIASYLYGYVKPGWTPDIGTFLAQPSGLVAYFLAYLGAPLTPEGDSPAIIAWAVTAGGVGLVVLAGLVRGKAAALAPPYLALSAYAILAAAATGVGRLGLGPSQALISRYVTISQLLWLAIAALLGLRASRAARAAAAAIALALGLASVSGVERFETAYRRFSAARAALVARRDGPALAVLHPDRAMLLVRARVLERLSLSVYRR